MPNSGIWGWLLFEISMECHFVLGQMFQILPLLFQDLEGEFKLPTAYPSIIVDKGIITP